MKKPSLVVTLTTLELQHLIDETVRKALGAKTNQKEYLTLLEVCQLLGIHRNTFNNYVNQGIIKKHKVGNRVLVKYSQLMETLELGKIG